MVVLLLDTYSLFFRAFHALPPMTTSQGQPTSALYGLCTLLLKLTREHTPAALAFALDAPGPTFRHRIYPDYKAGRPELPTSLRSQFPLLHELIATLQIPAFAVPGFEADDVLATLATRLTQQGHDVLIATGDRDLLQLIDPRVQVLFLGARGQPARMYDIAAIRARFGVDAAQLPSYVALCGDTSDNIPKLPGVGPVAARNLLGQHANLTELLGHLERVDKPSLRGQLERRKSELLRFEDLVRLRRDLDLGDGSLCASVPETARPGVEALFTRLEFRSLLPRLAPLFGRHGAVS